MHATSSLDRRLLRALRERPQHGYALARELAAEEGPDRATVYRRLGALARGGLVQARAVRGPGPPQRVYRLTAPGEEALRAELRDAMRLLLEAYDARGWRARSGGGWRMPRAPVVMVSGSRISGVELRILATLARAMPRRVHLVLPPGVEAPGRSPAALAVVEGTWRALPFRDGYARTLFVNELPPARALAASAQEWRRVLAPGGSLHAIAPAPLPRGTDPFIDFLAELHDELFPDQAGGPAPERVDAALRAAFGRVERARESNQLVWTARRAGH